MYEGTEPAAMAVRLRIPGWLPTATVAIGLNGNTSFIKAAGRGSYAEIRRVWHPNDTLTVRLEMELTAVEYLGVNQVAGARRFGTSLSGSISTILTILNLICAGIYMCGALPCPVCA